MINRDLLIIRFKQPFVDWVNQADPHPDSPKMTLDEVNEDTSAFLIHDYACEDFENWLEQCYLPMFERILAEWYVDESLWPQDRTAALFNAWCDCEVHSMVFDLVDDPLVDDEFYD